MKHLLLALALSAQFALAQDTTGEGIKENAQERREMRQENRAERKENREERRAMRQENRQERRSKIKEKKKAKKGSR